MAKSVWIVTEDLLDDGAAVGICGPRGVTEADIDLCEAKGKKFVLYDDDGEIYYRGKVLGDPGAPLWDWGVGYAGCTRIKVNGREV